ncbi:MAG: ATP-binding protein [Pseudomonadota bacterium]
MIFLHRDVLPLFLYSIWRSASWLAPSASLACTCFCIIFLSFANPALATQTPSRKVLIIYSWHDLMPWQAALRVGLQERLKQQTPAKKLELFEERLDAGRIEDAASDKGLYNYLSEKYAQVPLDAVIAESQSAATFLLRHPDLFIKAKRYAVNVSNPGDIPAKNAFVVKENPAQALLTIAQVMPDRERVVAVVDHSDYGRRIKDALMATRGSLPKTLTLEVMDNFSFDELYAKLVKLPPRSAILYFPTLHDRNGVGQIPYRVVQRLAEVSNAPIFAHHDTLLGSGIVGGYMVSARRVGDLVARIALDDVLPGNVEETDALVKSYQFDDKQLQRWGIADQRLPAPHTVINLVVSTWVSHRWQIAAAVAAFLLQAVLIAALVRSLRQRKKMTRLLADERDQLEQHVHERNRELSDIVNFNETILLHSPLPMGVYAGNGQCILANDAYAQLVGTTRTVLLTQNFHHIVALQRSGLLDDCLQALKQNVPKQREVHVVSSFGKEVWIAARILPTHLRGEPHLLIQFFDLSETKRAEEALTAANEQLILARDTAEAANRAKSQFLANMSHEIRTPMNAILGMLQLLQHTQLSTRQLDYAVKTQTAAQSLLSLLNDILDFSKVEANKLNLEHLPFQIDSLVRELSVISSASVGDKKIEVLFVLDPKLPDWIVGDGYRLRQVLINLIGNAIKFTRQGEVTLSLTVLTQEPDHTEIGFAVSDTGIGIGAVQLHTIFDAFTQAEASTSRQFGGTGLGLAISHRLVSLMDGVLQVESTPGVGSRFHFTLRFEHGAATHEPRPIAIKPGAKPLAGLRLLLVEDTPMNQQVAQELLASEGAQIELANSGSAGVAMAAASDPPYDAILMDIQMPDMDGYAATAAIRQQPRLESLPIIAMTANAMLTDIAACRAAGMDDHIAKPINLDDAVQTILRHCTAHMGDLATGIDPAPLAATTGFEFDLALRRIGGNTTLFATLARRFEPEVCAMLADCRQALVQGNQNRVAIGMHTIKGLAGTIGAPHLATLANAIEQQITTGNVADNIDASIDEAQVLVVQTCRALLDYCRHF